MEGPTINTGKREGEEFQIGATKPEHDKFVFTAGGVDVLVLTKDETFIRGEKVAGDDEAKKAFKAFSQWLEESREHRKKIRHDDVMVSSVVDLLKGSMLVLVGDHPPVEIRLCKDDREEMPTLEDAIRVVEREWENG